MGGGILQVRRAEIGAFCCCLAPPSLPPSCAGVAAQSARMTFTKLATSVSLASWEVKKGCCCKGEREKHRKELQFQHAL